MSDINDSLALIHGSYNTVQNLWGYAIDNGQVYQSDGTTVIAYSFLQQLPSYYTEEVEAYTISGASGMPFRSIDPNTTLDTQ
jgi:hypothetical protein